ncbi:hypothetical protein [Fluviicola sp.]|uniref:DUF7683 domain-containing protein n=1 Tax=Fluviicola sp. TaxID=1917219 RepID=UPI00261B6EC7|nr:hypothetical protein [Fluviicola sp.]
MKTKLLLTVFEKTGEKLVREIDISHYSLEKINKICPPDLPGDFQYCDGHFVEEEQYLKLKEFITEFSDYNYNDYDFNIGTFRIVD